MKIDGTLKRSDGEKELNAQLGIMMGWLMQNEVIDENSWFEVFRVSSLRFP